MRNPPGNGDCLALFSPRGSTAYEEEDLFPELRRVDRSDIEQIVACVSQLESEHIIATACHQRVHNIGCDVASSRLRATHDAPCPGCRGSPQPDFGNSNVSNRLSVSCGSPPISSPAGPASAPTPVVLDDRCAVLPVHLPGPLLPARDRGRCRLQPIFDDCKGYLFGEHLNQFGAEYKPGGQRPGLRDLVQLRALLFRQ
jgi:hypothetical protein